MAVSYKKLFKLMIDKDMKKKDLREATGLSYATINKLENGENVNMDVIDRICSGIDCSINDIVEFIPKRR